MSFRRSEATRNLRAGGRSDILLKAKPSGCAFEEARRRMPGDPAKRFYICRLSRERFKRSTPNGALKKNLLKYYTETYKIFYRVIYNKFSILLLYNSS